MKICAVIPAYNEEKTVAEVVEKTRDLVDEVIVVDDCSTDNTFREAKKAGAKTVRLIINMGAGFSTRIGCDIAVNDGANIIVTLDADGQHDPAEIPRLVQVLEEKGLDIGFGSRATNNEMPLTKRFGNTGLYWIAYLLYKVRIKDTQTGYHVFTKNAYEKIKWESNRYGVVSEIPVRVAKNELKHEEVIIKTIYTDKVRGISVLDGLKSGWMMLLWKFQK
jgi:glycosyltransferase involved in cell wall biosynthesis